MGINKDIESGGTPESFYAEAETQYHCIEDATIAVRVFGQGPAIVLIHGYPVSGYTWRKLLPALSAHYCCYVIDLPGLGDSDWMRSTDFSFTAQAHRLDLLFKKLKLDQLAIVAQDTGATIARLAALSETSPINKLAMLNTEMPGHRPPWIPLYQFMAKIPFSSIVFRLFMKTDCLVRSSMGLGGFYTDRTLFYSGDNIEPYVKPLANDARRLEGALNYLKGIEWARVDGLRAGHKVIKAEMLLLWGEDDKTFPVHLAEVMCAQFQRKPSFIRIPSASLMPHEERPAEVLEHLLPFLSGERR